MRPYVPVPSLLALILLGPGASILLAAPPSGLAKLQEALETPLRIPPGEVSPEKESLELRKRSLEKAVSELRQIDDMVQGLMLGEWRDLHSEDVGKIDRSVRRILEKRLQDDLRAALSKADAGRRLAAVTLIGEMGVEVRETGSLRSYARFFAGDLIEVLKDKDLAVRASAARALGRIGPEALPAAKALGDLLQSGDASDRQAAADGLAAMMDTAVRQRTNRHSQEELVGRRELIQTGEQVTSTVTRGLEDKNADVKRLCLEAVRLAATALQDEIRVPRPFFPPKDRPLSKVEKEEMEQYEQAVQALRQELQPLLKALSAAAPALVRALKDEDAKILIDAGKALEALAEARLRLLRLATGVPGTPKATDDLTELKKAVKPIAELLRHKAVRVRLAGLYVLESLEEASAPASGDIVKTCKDEDSFVRWAAARALGKIAPLEAASVVPALAALLADPNGDVRVTAAAALERYGREAKPALPEAAAAANRHDLDSRLWALRVLAAIGPDEKESVPALLKALAAKEPEIRVAVCRTLAGFGPPTKDTQEPLKTALNDPDARVRQAASGALLVTK